MLLFEMNAERVLHEVVPVFGPRLASVNRVQWVSWCIGGGDRWQLLEIELQDEQEPPEETAIASNKTCEFFESIKELAREDGRIIDCEHTRILPPPNSSRVKYL